MTICLSIIAKIKIDDGNDIDKVEHAKLVGVAISQDQTWIKYGETIVRKGLEGLYIYQFKRLSCVAHCLVTIVI